MGSPHPSGMHVAGSLLGRVAAAGLVLSAVLATPALVGATPPHDNTNSIECLDCHPLYQAGATAKPRDAEQETMCKSCHNVTGTAGSRPGLYEVGNHVVNGGTRIIDCGSCHIAHANRLSTTDPHDSQTADNLSLIRSNPDRYVPGAGQPIFHDRATDFAFAQGDPPWVGICQTCHTQTTHHTRDATSGHDHNVGSDCMGCHPHASGFILACSGCHGLPPVDGATLVSTPAPTGSTTAGAHTMHSTLQSYSCASCHVGSVGAGATHAGGQVSLGFSLFGGSVVGGEYDGQAAVAYDASDGATIVSSGGSLTCSKVYCHGEQSNGNPWGGGVATSPRWDSTVSCGDCHDLAGAGTSLSARHVKHTDAGGYAFTCEKCHVATSSDGSTVTDRAPHANGVPDVEFAAGGTYNGGSCTQTYCHSNGAGGMPYTAVDWSMSGPLTCTGCHPGGAGEAIEMNTAGHDRLVSSNWVRQYPCEYCHAATVDAAGQLVDLSRHVNETKDVAISAQWNITGAPLPSYDAATKVCDNVYCHSDGTTVNPQVRDFAWTQGRTACNTCHGHEQGECAGCHADGRTSWPPGDEWKAAMPMYANGGAGTELANTHKRHLLTNFACDNCHANTIANGTCTDCHTSTIPLGSMDEVNHIDPAYHVNKVKDLAFRDGGTYDPVTKTCSNTACHTGADPQWGDSVDTAVLCFECHGSTVGDVDDFVVFSGTRARIDMTEWVDTGHGRPAASGNYDSGNPPADFPGNPCWYCHDNDVLHNDVANPFRLRQHFQFNSRFDKECVFCHMEGIDTECMTCHDSAISLAPQLVDFAGPPDHAPFSGGATSCVASCHSTDADRHNTGAGIWTAAEKADVRNQYVMMGVCLVCHEDDSNGQCESCHTGAQYEIGFDAGLGRITATTKATSAHFGWKHYAQYQSTGVWKGGKFCWDCHDPHGDTNIFMIQDEVATETDGTFGIPSSRATVSFTRKQTGLDYARTSAPYDGICNVCHTEAGQHYRYDYGDGHNAGRICTTCHNHRFSDGHASGQACDSCHRRRPVPRHTAFAQPRDCTKCHDGVVGDRMDILGQLRSNSHHIQGTTVTSRHCYACHWEARPEGIIDVAYHGGYNLDEHTSQPGSLVDLVIWGPGARPTVYQAGVTAVTFDAGAIGSAGERANVGNVTNHCLGCHSDQNADTRPFDIVDPAGGDCKTPRQYAWDGTSIADRYSQSGTVTFGKYTAEALAAAKNIQKALSPHGNAPANEGGWDPATGEDEALPNTRAGGEAVQCFDCHSSHGSKTQGVTSNYVTFNGTNNGANLKETQAGKGGYLMSYKAAAGGGGVNSHNAGAAQCFDCHESAVAGATPWGYASTFGATAPIQGYRDGSRFGAGARGVTDRFAFKAGQEVVGGHFAASAPLEFAANHSIDGLCAPCHDPHGVSPTLGADQAYAVPALKGTWLTSPYKEDRPIAGLSSGARGSKTNQFPTPTPNIYIDQTTFAGGATIAESVTQFAGLCLSCHDKAGLTDGVDNNGLWRSKDRVHESVKGWGDNTKHNYPCSKCHQAHNSGRGELLRTNGLDVEHRGRVVSGGTAGVGSKGSFPLGRDLRMINCHPAGPWPDNSWNNVTPW